MRRSLRILLPYLLRYKRNLTLGAAALLGRNLLAVSLPLLIAAAVDSLTAGFRFSIVLWLCAGLVGLSAAKGICQYWMRVILIGISRDIEYDLRNDLFGHLVKLSQDFFARYRTGDIMARATNDLNAVRMMLGPGLMYSTDTIVTAVLAITVMASVDWLLTLVMLLPAPLVTLAVMVFGRRIHRRFERIQELFSDISSRVQENISGVRIIRAYVQEQSELQQFEMLNQDYIRQNLRLAKISGLFMPALHGLIGLTFLLVLWAGGYRLLTGQITIGNFLMFNVFMGMLIWPMIALGWVVNLVQRGNASLFRLHGVLSDSPSIAPPSAPRELPEPLAGAVEFRNVHVRYSAVHAVRGVTLSIPVGATVAFVGHTGSGKSTLLQLVPRMLDPDSGAVLVDGIDLREVSPSALRRQIGFVPQETFLFSATLAENIAFGVKSASEEEIRRAADLAGLTPDVEGFPAGFQTMIGERGITLSGGQKQRTAIARAILRDPRILILDDALSSVDTLTEERVLRGLSEIMRGRTTILVSHRVSTVRHADRIFVIENGAVAEEGTHAELLSLKGYYADLHLKQQLEEELQAI